MDTTDATPDDETSELSSVSAARVIGLDDSDQNLLFESDGQRFSVPVDGELRRLVRRARSTPTSPAAAAASILHDEDATPNQPELTPREIQTRMRAGESPEDIAEATNGDVESIRRYESPIIAERNYVIEQAQGAPIARDPEAPLLGEITVDRLAARGVSAQELEWSAYRIPGSRWTVELRFVAGDRERSATWSFEPRSRLVSALDDESRWLTEPEEPRDEPIPTRLTPVSDWVYDVDADGGGLDKEEPEEDDMMARQQDLLDELSSRRGRRQPLLGEDEEDPFDLLSDIPAAHPPASKPEEAVDAEILQLPEAPSDEEAEQIASEIGDVEAVETDEPVEEEPTAGKHEKPERDEEDESEEKKPKPSRRSARRASVPSWDEIVFGARTD